MNLTSTNTVQLGRSSFAVSAAVPVLALWIVVGVTSSVYSGDIINPLPPFDLYTVEFDGDLFGVDADTGDATFIGNTGLTAPAGLEFEPATNRLLLLRASGTEHAMYQVNTADASVLKLYDLTFPPGVERMFEGSFDFDSNGLIYATNTGSNDDAGLLTIDPLTGQGTYIGEFPGELRDINGMVFRSDGVLVGIENYSSSFVSINTSNAVLGFIDGLDSDLTDTSGGLTTVDGQTGYLMTSLGVLHQIDLFTGQTMLIGSNGVAGGPQFDLISGLAAVVPEPASLALVFGAFIAVVFRRAVPPPGWRR
jgi:hypothetical protein